VTSVRQPSSRQVWKSHPFRKALFQIHLWLGLALAIYVVVIGLTGSILVFRGDLQKLTFPEFFTVERHGEPDAPLPTILAELQRRYPDTQVSGLDFPTQRRQTFLTYLTRGGQFLTVFSNPITAQVIGELPKTSWITRLQDLHYDLLAGPTGRKISGVAAACLIAMFTTGLVLWWPGMKRWTRGLWIDTRAGWKRINWDLHSVVGFWTFVLVMMWAVSGVEFAFPQPFRKAVNAVSPLTVTRSPESRAKASSSPRILQPADHIAKAQALEPGAHPGRYVTAFGRRDAVLVLMARVDHGDFDRSDEISLYFDQYTGALLERHAAADESTSLGDTVMKWLGPLHTATFGGSIVRILWAIFGLSFPALAITGFIMWWNRSR
jgi:uncharacterized iron-regulated membrane protein